MLSSPPAAFAASTSAFAAAVEIVPVLLDELEDRVVVDHVGQAVRAEEEDVLRRAASTAIVSISTSGSVPTRARDHRSVRDAFRPPPPSGGRSARAPRRASGPPSPARAVRRGRGRRASRRRARSRRRRPRRGRSSSSCPCRRPPRPRPRARRRCGSRPRSSATTRSRPSRPGGRERPTAAAASRDASSPACAPPIPSAIANSGGSQTYASSLCRRRRPASESPADCATHRHRSKRRSVSPTRTTSPGTSLRGRRSAGRR